MSLYSHVGAITFQRTCSLGLGAEDGVSGSSKMLVTTYKTIWSTPAPHLRGSQSEFTLPFTHVKRENS